MHTLGLVLVLAAAVASAIALPSTPMGTSQNGATASVDAYPGGVLRLRIRPSGRTMFEVTDVVEAKPVAAGTPTCTNNVCTIEHGTARLEVASSMEQTNVFDVKYTVSGEETTTARLTVRDNDGPEGFFNFPRAEKLYGIPERAIDLALKDDKSYRLYNLDVFQYKLDDEKGIYGTIPFLMAHGRSATTAILWLNGADTTVNVGRQGTPTSTWTSESGIHDVFFFPGTTPKEVHVQHSGIVGPTLMPPLFSLGYHQCRWNYRSSNDCLEVDNGFDAHNIPYDVLWLDIEHTDGKRYFTWDKYNFPDPKGLVEAVAAKGRQMVTITDPHIKRDDNYHVHKQATSQGYYVKNEAGHDYEGHCWPGTSSWVDFYNADARNWYATLFKHDAYEGSTPNLYSWIDMNEPSVFNSHEVTMDKNAVHKNADGTQWRHRDLHNMYGYYHTMAAFQGHLLRSHDANSQPTTRPFILTRSFFSGSQRYAAMWTGDNMADWGHLSKSIPMLLTLSLSNYIFVGADVGGFFNNPETELLVRWYQAAAFYPFFRGHAHLETKRREPWLFGDDATRRIRDAIALRYSLLPYTYTRFFRAHDQGTNLIRPFFYEWPTQGFFEEQNAFMFGPALMVRPVVEQAAASIHVPLPAGETWYTFPTGEKLSGTTHTMNVDMDTIPVFIRGGYMVPTRHRLRRSTAAMHSDPISLYIALDANGKASGELYLDDSHSYNFQKGGYSLTKWTFADGVLTSEPTKASSAPAPDASIFSANVAIERVVIFGYNGAATKAEIEGKAVAVSGAQNGVLVIRKPDAVVGKSWSIKLA